MPAANVKKMDADEPELENIILRGVLTSRALLLDKGFSGLRIVDSRFSRDTVRLTQFAARNRIPHTSVAVEENAGAAEILTRLGVSVDAMPVVITGSGDVLRHPTIVELADTMGLMTPSARSEMVDLRIVGPPSGRFRVLRCTSGARRATRRASVARGTRSREPGIPDRRRSE